MRTYAFIQARMGSSRLPGKVLLPIDGKPVIEHVVQRVASAECVDDVVVLTTDKELDKEIVNWCNDKKVNIFIGSENDVLDRFYRASRQYKPDLIFRITADCPLIDPNVLLDVFNKFSSGNYDYVNNCDNETYPDGLDVELFKASVLDYAWNNAKLLSEREHVTPYIRKHPDIFNIGILDYYPSLGDMRWTLDQEEDYEFIKRIYEELGSDYIFGMEEILELLNKKPEIREINNNITRNEGYIKSIQNDKSI